MADKITRAECERWLKWEYAKNYEQLFAAKLLEFANAYRHRRLCLAMPCKKCDELDDLLREFDDSTTPPPPPPE